MIQAMLDDDQEQQIRRERIARIEEALKTSGRSQASIAAQLRITPQAVTGWLKTGNIGQDALHFISLEAKPALNPNWVYSGTPPKYMREFARHIVTFEGEEAWIPNRAPASLPNVSGPQADPYQYGRKVPLLSWISAGDFCACEDQTAAPDPENYEFCGQRCSERTFALRVTGESMWNPQGRPSFRDGDLIFVDPDVAAKHGDCVVVRLTSENAATFKRLLIQGDRRYLEALNPAWPNRIMEIDGEATICGVVIWTGHKP